MKRIEMLVTKETLIMVTKETLILVTKETAYAKETKNENMEARNQKEKPGMAKRMVFVLSHL